MDGVLAPAACTSGNGPPQCQNGAPRSAARCLPDPVFGSFPTPRRRRSAGNAPATGPRSVHRHAKGSGGTPVDRSADPACGLAAAGWILVLRGSAAPPAACWRARPLPVPGAGVHSPVSAGHSLSAASRSPAAPDLTLVWEQIRCSHAARSALADRMSSTLQYRNGSICPANSFGRPNLQPSQAGKQIPCTLPVCRIKLFAEPIEFRIVYLPATRLEEPLKTGGGPFDQNHCWRTHFTDNNTVVSVKYTSTS